MSWVFTGLMKRARDFGRAQARRLNEAYARWYKKHRTLPHAVGNRSGGCSGPVSASAGGPYAARDSVLNFGEHPF